MALLFGKSLKWLDDLIQKRSGMLQKIKLHIILLACFSLFNSPIQAADSVMDVIALKYRPASEIQALIAPLLEPTDRVIANGLTLILKTTPQRLAEIKQLIAKLDTGLTNLLITVVQGQNISVDDFNASAKLHADFSLNRPSLSNINIKGHYYQTKNKNTIDNTQTLRTIEGRAAYIRVGKVHPVEHIQLQSQGFGYPLVASHTDYIEATTGFEVVPRLTANGVLLTISPWAEHLNNSTDQITTQGAQTTIRVRLGTWVEIGGNTESSRHNRDGISRKVRRTQTGDTHILIKVDRAD